MRCKFYVCYGSRFNARTGTRPCAPRPSARAGTPRCSVRSRVLLLHQYGKGLLQRRAAVRERDVDGPKPNTHTLVQPRAPRNRRRSSGTDLPVMETFTRKTRIAKQMSVRGI